MAGQKKAVLRLPLIGKFEKIDALDAVGKIVELTGNDEEKNEEKNKALQNLERALGDYLIDSGGYQKILDLLFPGPKTIDVKKVFNWSKNDFPLFSWVFAESTRKSDSTGNKDRELELSSAWSALMLELGEFKLDEQFKELENEIKYMMQYFYQNWKKPNESTVLYAMFEDNTGIINEIWKRILGKDICLIFIDDDEMFNIIWGLKDFHQIGIDESSDPKKFKSFQGMEKNAVWINPVLKDNTGGVRFGYNKDLTRDKVIEIINQKCTGKAGAKLPVLVIDLLYLDDKGINKIEGDNLMRELRSKECGIKTPLIIGFTAGKSPFVINSAVKAGADIVIQKERGENIKLSDLQHGSGNPGGLFDLLWALSKNISRWRFLEECKKYLHDELKGKSFYRPVLEPLFFSIENESPFWKEYLNNWLREVEDIRLKAIFENNEENEPD